MFTIQELLISAQRQINQFVRDNGSKITTTEEQGVLTNLSIIAENIGKLLDPTSSDVNRESILERNFQSQVINPLTKALSSLVIPDYYFGLIQRKGMKVLPLHSVLSVLINSLVEQEKSYLKVKKGASEEQKSRVERRLDELDEEMRGLKRTHAETMEQNARLADEAKRARIAEEAATRQVVAVQDALTDFFEQLLSRHPRLGGSLPEIAASASNGHLVPVGGGAPQSNFLLSIAERAVSAQMQQAQAIMKVGMPEGYEIPLGFERSMMLSDWKRQAQNARDYQLGKLCKILSTRRYLAVAHLLKYIDSCQSTLALVGSSTTDAPQCKALALKLILCTVFSQSTRWEELQFVFSQQMQSLEGINHSVLQGTLETIASIDGAVVDDDHIAATPKEIARTIRSMLCSEEKSKGLFDRLIPKGQRELLSFVDEVVSTESFDDTKLFAKVVEADGDRLLSPSK